MRRRGQVWVVSLLGAVALVAPACDDGEDGVSNNTTGGTAGTAGHANAAGHANTAGQTNTAGNTNTAGADNHGDAGNGGGGGGTGGAGGADCTSAPVDPASGVVTCGDYKYRELVGQGCPYSPSDTQAQGGAGGVGGAAGGASTTLGGAGGEASGCDPSKCTDKPRGYCEAEAPGAAGAGPVTCHYGCLVDNDCGADEICLCSDPSYGGRCVHAFCKTDADCDDGKRCGSAVACDQFSCNDNPSCAFN